MPELKSASFLAFAALFCVAQCQNPMDNSRFRVIREWKYLNFSWPSEDVERSALATGLYVPGNNLIAGIKHFGDHFYLTLPRMKNGVVATLARIPADTSAGTAPALEPYPSWEMNNMQDCGSLHNVQNVEISPGGEMWIIDSGKVETLLPQRRTNCPAKLVIFDMNAQAVVLSYVFPDEVASRGSNFLYDIVLDHDDTDGEYAYITDNSNVDPGIIVYSRQQNRSWKIRHSQSMRADPMATHFLVNGANVNTPINIAGIALGPKMMSRDSNGLTITEREVYYSPLSSLNLYSVATSVLKNEQNGQGEYQGDVKNIGQKTSQTVAMTMDNKGVLYMGLLALNSIVRWDSHTPFSSGQKTIGHDNEYIQWPHSFAFDRSGNIVVTSNKLQSFIYQNLNLVENNFRILEAHVGSMSYLFDNDSMMNVVPENDQNHMGHGQMDHTQQGMNTTNMNQSSANAVVSSLLSLMFLVIALL